MKGKNYQSGAQSHPVRLDKWLWAARFFKTRGLARQAIDGGKVFVAGVRAKPGRLLNTGMLLSVRVGFDQRDVEVLLLSDKRGPATSARTLYRESAASLVRREHAIAERKIATRVVQYDPQKPSKHQRRDMHQFKRRDPSA